MKNHLELAENLPGSTQRSPFPSRRRKYYLFFTVFHFQIKKKKIS